MESDRWPRKWKSIYERSLGKPISYQTWCRVRSVLGLTGAQLSELDDLETFAYLRKTSPRSRIGYDDIAKYRGMVGVMGDRVCSAADIKDTIARMITPSPHISTMYRWGKEIGVPIAGKRELTREERDKWIAKIVIQAEK